MAKINVLLKLFFVTKAENYLTKHCCGGSRISQTGGGGARQPLSLGKNLLFDGASLALPWSDNDITQENSGGYQYSNRNVVFNRHSYTS